MAINLVINGSKGQRMVGGMIFALPIAFLLGVAVDSGYTSRAQDARDRRLAAAQRDLNERYRALRERQEVDEEEVRWLSMQQSGMTVIEHEVTNETPRLPAGRRGYHR